MYGVQKSSEVTDGSANAGFKFGLNQGANLIKFEYNPKAGKEGADQDALDIAVNLKGKEFRLRYFPISKVFREGRDANGAQLQGEITDTSSEEYQEAVKRDTKRLNAILTDFVLCVVPEEVLNGALNTSISSFKDFVVILERLVKANPEWNTTSIDIFLQYQWQPKGEQNKTFLELPTTGAKVKSIRYGQFVCKEVEGDFKEVPLTTGIKYATEEGVEHPFVRNAWFKASDFAKPTIIEEEATTDMGGNTGAAGTDW